MAIFLEEVGSRAQDAFDSFMKIMETYENAPKNSFSDDELKQLDRLSCEVVTLMTSTQSSKKNKLYLLTCY